MGILSPITNLLFDKPNTPDFWGAASSTGMQNRPNVNTPWSSLNWTTDKDGRPQLSFGLSGKANDALSSLQGNMASAAGMDPAVARDQAISSNFNQGWSRLRPQQQLEQDAFRSQMANSGLDAGTEAYNRAGGLLSRNQTDQFNSLLNGAISAGNQTQQTQIAQSMLPYQQYASLIGSSIQQPRYGQGADYMGAANAQYQADSNNASMSNMGLNSLLQGGMSVMKGGQDMGWWGKQP